jgi:hypothetical protein
MEVLFVVQKHLNQIVEEQPFHDYAKWWNLGSVFSEFMSESLIYQWFGLHHNNGDFRLVKNDVSEYLKVVYGRKARVSLVEEFVNKTFSYPIQSGEFDALSYSFYRSAFQFIENHLKEYEQSLTRERRRFTKRVGKIFFQQVRHYLNLDLPIGLTDEPSFIRLKASLQNLGTFLKTQGYLRDHFDFKFDLDVEYAGKRIVQTESAFMANLENKGIAYALYEMGYPAILPSAVYLYHTIGEAQHHSSRTIEELFELMGYEARETDDFDPMGYPSNRVVELWEIRKW